MTPLAVLDGPADPVITDGPHVAALVRSKKTDKQLLLAAIEAVAWIRPQEAAELLTDLTDSADEDVVEAVYEALAMAGGSLDDDDDEDDDENELLR